MKPIVFIHIPRTAGVSIYRAFVRLEQAGHLSLQNLTKSTEHFKPDCDVTFLGHRYIGALLSQRVFSAAWLATRHIMSFVRNPWDRLVSLYEYLVHIPNRVHDIPRKGLASFPAFVDYVCHHAKPLGTEAPTVASRDIIGLAQCNPQSDWLPGSVWRPKIGHYEALSGDWAQFSYALELPIIELLHKNPSIRKPYRPYYTDETQQLTEIRYYADIERFGYTF